MVAPSPTSVLGSLIESIKLPPAPTWLVDELQQRLVLFLNHVLMQEPEAQARLKRQTGRVMLVQWRGLSLKLEATPAGLLDRSKPHARPDLTLTIPEPSPVALAQSVLQGQRPAVTIEGDVQLAAEINWLVEHVRWDQEEDLARIVGDAPAHWLAEAARAMSSALRSVLGSLESRKGQP